MTQPLVPTEPTVSPLRLREALEKVKPAMAALEPPELYDINIDIMAGTIVVLGNLPELRALRPQLATLQGFDLDQFDALEDFTLAAMQTAGQYIAASSPPEPIPELVEELTKTRDLLVSDVVALSKRGLLDGSRLGELKGPVGYKNLASDIIALAAMFRDSWAKVVGKTSVSIAELDRAEHVVLRLTTAIGLKEQGTSAVTEAAAARQRAFTLFVQAYDEARRGVSYLRWKEGDADTIAPSLWAGRGGSKRKAQGVGDPGAQPAQPPAPASPVVGAPATTVVAPPGMPGNSPLTP